MDLLLPDFLAMAVLLGTLYGLRRRCPQEDIGLWLGGLLFILLECAARIAYEWWPSDWRHRAAHIIALDAYLLAGVLFLCSALKYLRVPSRRWMFLALNTLPFAVLLTWYGGKWTGAAVPIAIAACGLIIAAASTLLLRRPRVYLVVLPATWVVVAAAYLLESTRFAVYLALALVYLAAAVGFARNLPRTGSGRLLVVSGFLLWAACFITHPWIATRHPGWISFASEVWNMQKFLITVGFLMVLFESRVDSMEQLALHDSLTGLPNRRLFQDRITRAIARAERNRTALLYMAMDLNRFKEVNDTLGHDAGDTVLRTVASRMEHVIRRTDTLARVGGDEFLLIATDFETAQSRQVEHGRQSTQDVSAMEQLSRSTEGMSAETAELVLLHASRIEQNLRIAAARPVTLQSGKGTIMVEVSASLGMAVYPTDSTDLAELARIADRRMYEDKRSRKGRDDQSERLVSSAASAS